MLSIRGVIQGNKVVLEEDVSEYDGREVIVTILDCPDKKKDSMQLDLDRFVTPTERGKKADEYIEELRVNDRV